MHVSLEIVERRVIAFPVCFHDRAETFVTAIYRQNRNVRGVFFTIYNTRFLYKKKKKLPFLLPVLNIRLLMMQYSLGM